MFCGKKSVWSVYRVAGEVYGSKLVGHYCSPGAAYRVALRKQINMRNEEFNVFIRENMCIREELHKLQHEAVNSKDFLNKVIYHVKATELSDELKIHKCDTCASYPPGCLR
jgi:hypothetical protein